MTTTKSTAVKGLAAVEIMIGHLGIATGFLFLYPSRKAGILFVGIFFMISGYGVMKNLLNKKDYLKNFMLKRILVVMIPAYTIHLLYGMLKILSANIKISIEDILSYVGFKEFFIRTNWYVLRL